jgi:large subunit ribosomal protein L20
MTRVKKGKHALKTRRNILKMAKGFRNGRKSKERQAYEQLAHSFASAFIHRRDKKGDFRRLWNVKINASLRAIGYNYSKFMGACKAKNIAVDRKILAELAEHSPESFATLAKQVMA